MSCTARTRISAREDEAQLIAAARQGNEEAFSALYRQQLRYVRAIVRSMLHSDEVDDVCQEVFLRAFTGLPGFAEACSFRTWISRITMYECLRTVRRFRQASNGGRVLVPLDESAVATDGGLASVPARLDLERMLDALSPAQRQILELTYLEDMQAGEIAAMLGTTVGQVRSMLHRAKRKVRKNS